MNISLSDLAYTVCPDGNPRRVVMFLHGRGEVDRRDRLYPWERRLVDEGCCFFYPFYGPWSWGTPDVSRYLDDLLDQLLADLGHAEGEAPELVLSGGSMGGQVALQHLRYSRHRFARCFVLAPVTDLAACFRDLPDVRRSLSAGLLHQTGSLPEKLGRFSPLSAIASFPDIPILMLHGDQDPLVPVALHGLPFAEAMRQAGYRVELGIFPGGHDAVPAYSGWDQRRHWFLMTGEMEEAVPASGSSGTA